MVLSSSGPAELAVGVGSTSRLVMAGTGKGTCLFDHRNISLTRWNSISQASERHHVVEKFLGLRAKFTPQNGLLLIPMFVSHKLPIHFILESLDNERSHSEVDEVGGSIARIAVSVAQSPTTNFPHQCVSQFGVFGFFLCNFFPTILGVRQIRMAW